MRVKPRLVVMNDVIRFGGRGNPEAEQKPKALEAAKGNVYCLVMSVRGIEFISYYCHMVVIDPWGIRMVNPFRRVSVFHHGCDFADYLPKDLYIFRKARLEEIPLQEWMQREIY